MRLCTVHGCEQELAAKGFCNTHYNGWRRYGDPLVQKHESHGHATGGSSTEYTIWRSMKDRCHNPKCGGYERYGGRGISVCERWRKSFTAFLADVGPRPSALHSLDRTENDKGYEPGNVVWATKKVQQRNTRSNATLTINGVTKCLTEWSELSGIDFTTIRGRLRRNWDASAAVFTPPNPIFRRKEQSL